MKKKLILLALATIALIAAFKYLPKDCDCEVGDRITIGNTEVAVDTADTPEERVRGLSGQESLKEGEGMLFVFEEPLVAGFWMKDMRFAIDIIWIDEERRVIGIERDIKPETYPEVFRPSEAVKYVLEVSAGFSQGHGIDIGEEVYLAF